MTDKKNQFQDQNSCSTAGMGFARTEGGANIAPENCGLPQRGFATTDAAEKTPAPEETAEENDCSTAGMGFARTDKTKIAAENCASPGKGFATTDFGKKK
ncbi:hypothetical protein P22_0422 [Propionispora sp. 2/2-37]|uniref:hypothetical protein n=1 Tax=Propionispora sp. 2/2-37 TaxID=1677858 RepID=UPI0006BB8015|nr:hypothetical protein [Propionispora sp. 2/2-37]CUH94356.1 hypothetical protein P22_0422 [Propionispora sp. 2/2-37]